MKQIEVQILQQSYLLSCPEGHESRLLDAVERVDTAMVRIRDGGKVRSRERIAVLAALNLAFEIADREAADLAASHATSQVPAPAAFAPHPGHPDTVWPEEEAMQMQALIARLDLVLGEDEQLL